MPIFFFLSLGRHEEKWSSIFSLAEAVEFGM